MMAADEKLFASAFLKLLLCPSDMLWYFFHDRQINY